jgi:hypothetical protein
MPLIEQLSKGLHAARELGWSAMFRYGLYQISLRSGYLRLRTPAASQESGAPAGFVFPELFTLPQASQLRKLLGDRAAEVIQEADEIVTARFRMFGGPTVPLQLVPDPPLEHWSRSVDHAGPHGDIKLTWEPARFGWVFTLGRAYQLTQNDTYAQAFWSHFETFIDGNPPYAGPNWASAQEAALRILAFAFAGQIFARSPQSTGARIQRLAGAVYDHARRIPPTLNYALAQNNNHLITEALGLFLAGWLLRDGSPNPGFDTRKILQWQKSGWLWLNKALQRQIEADGAYIQHSVNYHRLMLHAALIGQLVARRQGYPYPAATLEKLKAATQWLFAQMDPVSGKAPNLGHNDGALILPLSPGDFRDQRPVLQAGSRGFLGNAALPAGVWDELSLWLGITPDEEGASPVLTIPTTNRLGDSRRWAAIRAVRFHNRPAHADQLHVEIWSNGNNLALDAGTYRYTAAPPWENALASTLVHNTVSIDSHDQMLRAGKFLWLNRAQARLLPAAATGQITAEHDGYRRLGLLHRRTLENITPEQWRIHDVVLPLHPGAPACTAVVHWLLPDYPWQLDGSTLTLTTPGGPVTLRIAVDQPAAAELKWVQLVRAGEVLAGPTDAPQILGWFSPTYNVRHPALSFRAAFAGQPPFHFVTEWLFSGNLQAQSAEVG